MHWLPFTVTSAVAFQPAPGRPRTLAAGRDAGSKRALAVACWALFLGGCAEGAYDLRVVFDPTSLAEDAVRVEVALVASCGGQTPGEAPIDAVAMVALTRMEQPAALGHAEPGRYGLYARAFDAACGVIASGCQDVELAAGGSGTLVVTVRALAGRPCPPDRACDRGVCDSAMDGSVPADAAPADGSSVADGAEIDGQEVPGDGGDTDAAVSCSCAPCADCITGACEPHHERCDRDAFCDVTLGCRMGTACEVTEPRCPDDGDGCTIERCDMDRDPALCVVDPAIDLTACGSGPSAGRCHGGACCAGCWDGAACQSGDALMACGGGGAACEDCDDGNPCTDDICGASGCVHAADDRNSCPTGTCHGGACCIGCWDGSGCHPGNEATFCGADGASCGSCACPTPGCATGVCAVAHHPAVVSAGPQNSCAVSTDGMLFCWGDNMFGQLGLGTSGVGTETEAPARVGSRRDWAEVAVGQWHVCALTTGGEVYCWGENDNGCLGTGGTADASSPTRVSGGPFASVLARNDRSCAFTATGALYCWGENDDGDLGIGDTSDRHLPALVPAPSGATRWRQLALGYEHSCGIDDRGRLYCWGLNEMGPLGVGVAEVNRSPNPVPLRVGTDEDWMAVGAGSDHTCAIKTDRSLWCWGANWDGQLGDGTRNGEPGCDAASADICVADPICISGMGAGCAQGPLPFAAFAGGEDHGCALDTAGRLYCWGENSSGQIGNGSTGSAVRSPSVVGMASDWAAMGIGEDHQCVIRGTADATLYCWGKNGPHSPPAPPYGGQLGLGDTTNRSSPVAVCFPL